MSTPNLLPLAPTTSSSSSNSQSLDAAAPTAVIASPAATSTLTSAAGASETSEPNCIVRLFSCIGGLLSRLFCALFCCQWGPQATSESPIPIPGPVSGEQAQQSAASTSAPAAPLAALEPPKPPVYFAVPPLTPGTKATQRAHEAAEVRQAFSVLLGQAPPVPVPATPAPAAAAHPFSPALCNDLKGVVERLLQESVQQPPVERDITAELEACARQGTPQREASGDDDIDKIIQACLVTPPVPALAPVLPPVLATAPAPALGPVFSALASIDLGELRAKQEAEAAAQAETANAYRARLEAIKQRLRAIGNPAPASVPNRQLANGQPPLPASAAQASAPALPLPSTPVRISPLKADVRSTESVQRAANAALSAADAVLVVGNTPPLQRLQMVSPSSPLSGDPEQVEVMRQTQRNALSPSSIAAAVSPAKA